MRLTLTLFSMCFCCLSFAQFQTPTQFRTANEYVPKNFSPFRYGTNMGVYPPYTDFNLANIAAKAGADAMRPALFESFLEKWGYDIRLDAFKHYADLGMTENVLFLGYPSDAHKEKTIFCGKEPSTLFANLYEPIWKNSDSGVVINEKNYYANYVYKVVSRYKNQVRFYEIWNEPDYSLTVKSELPAGIAGSWWTTNPDPCDYALHAPVQCYIRMLRISYEVIKKFDPDGLIAVGGIGYPSFLDVLLRQTDNPKDGTITKEYPNRGGAYFDVLSYHSYPHIDNSVRAWSDKINGFEYFRHSDKAVQGVIQKKLNFEAVLNNYGFNDIRLPKKHFIITECNIPAIAKGEFMGGLEVQRNFIMKALLRCQEQNILQFHVYSLSELKSDKEASSEFDKMGLYKPIYYTPEDKTLFTLAGLGYQSTALILKGFAYSVTETKKLNVNPNSNVVGLAFKKFNSDEIIYALWAATSIDQSEFAQVEFSFSDSLRLKSLKRYDWDYAQTLESQTVDSKFIQLTGVPQFFSTHVSVVQPQTNQNILNVYPNPVDSEVVINYNLNAESVINLKIFDASQKGTIVLIQNQRTQIGSHEWHYNFKKFPAGIYFVQLTIGKKIITKKIIKL